ncbi:MAG: hypothetical protein J1F05_02180 [Muribaculaceae bacterium]|nr:hypothetical protein [Muribaculaceae bacterium]
MKIRNLTLALGAAILIGTLSSCNGNGPDNPTVFYTDIVTVTSLRENGAVFTLREKEDSELITLTTTQSVPAVDFVEGDRVVLVYTPASGEHYVSDNVVVSAASKAFGEGKPTATLPLEKIKASVSAPVQMWNIARNGEYLDVIFQCWTSPMVINCQLVASAESLDDEYPELYLLFDPILESNQNNYAFYMSYSMANIFQRENCKGVKVYYSNDEIFPFTKVVQVEKSSMSTKPSLPTE